MEDNSYNKKFKPSHLAIYLVLQLLRLRYTNKYKIALTFLLSS